MTCRRRRGCLGATVFCGGTRAACGGVGAVLSAGLLGVGLGGRGRDCRAVMDGGVVVTRRAHRGCHGDWC